MPLKRKRVKAKKTVEYPNVAQAQADRRRFLKLLGKGLLGVSVLGLARCGDGAGRYLMGDGQGEDVLGVEDTFYEPDWALGGVAPPPDHLPQPDLYEEPDLVEEFPPLAGGMPAPDIHIEPDQIQQPDTCTVDKDVLTEPDWELGGVAPMPDAYSPHVDAGSSADVQADAETDSEEFPPLAGDMPAPE